MVAELIGIAIAGLGIGSLITFFVTRHDKKKGTDELTKENAEEIKQIKAEVEIIKEMSLGALYDRAKFVGESYIHRGYITMSEYSDWHKYLYQPYHNAGGDGTVDKIARELSNLPIEG